MVQFCMFVSSVDLWICHKRMLRIRSVCFHVDDFCFIFVMCALLLIVIKVSMTPQLLMFKSVTTGSFYRNLKPSWKVWIIRFWNPSYNIIDIIVISHKNWYLTRHQWWIMTCVASWEKYAKGTSLINMSLKREWTEV